MISPRVHNIKNTLTPCDWHAPCGMKGESARRTPLQLPSPLRRHHPSLLGGRHLHGRRWLPCHLWWQQEVSEREAAQVLWFDRVWYFGVILLANQGGPPLMSTSTSSSSNHCLCRWSWGHCRHNQYYKINFSWRQSIFFSGSHTRKPPAKM